MLAMQHPYVVVAPAETMHVEAWAGSGKPVAVIPGLFGASFTFRKVVPLLAAQGFRPIVIEPLGTGFSSRPLKADYSLAAQAHRLLGIEADAFLHGERRIAGTHGVVFVGQRRPE